MNKMARLIAFYLPQFHPIPENNEWWGKGFTEWLNVAKARPLFRGHYQPRIPTDLGFYDLRVPETRIAQAEMARQHGIEGFCYYHYWFAGKRLLERPFEEMLAAGEPDFPFCLCWVNQSWSGIWHGAPNRTLIEQPYPGYHDHKTHFNTLLRAFVDSRYITVDGKPLFLIFSPRTLPDVNDVLDFWRDLAIRSGLKGLYIVGVLHQDTVPDKHNFDAFVINRFTPTFSRVTRLQKVLWRFTYKGQKMRGWPDVYPYKYFASEGFKEELVRQGIYPQVVPNWDNTPRSGSSGVVLHGSTPDLFRIHLKGAIRAIESLDVEQRIVFIKSWNEWAEGNYLEPDLRFGKQYLEVIKDELLHRKADSRDS
jgi:lipopolysaccharide biosynthesis protein